MSELHVAQLSDLVLAQNLQASERASERVELNGMQRLDQQEAMRAEEAMN